MRTLITLVAFSAVLVSVLSGLTPCTDIRSSRLPGSYQNPEISHSSSWNYSPPTVRSFSPSSSPAPESPPGPEDRAEYMIGTVAVTVIFLESNGAFDPNTENWTQIRMDKALNEIHLGLAWWETQMPNGRLEFSVYSLGQQPTSYEPITRPSSHQYMWVEEVMNNLGYTSGDYIQDVIDLNNDMRSAYGKDWAFTAFVVDSLNDIDGTFSDGVSAYAYGMGGPFLVMTYDNDGWGINNMDRVMAHETGHMFYATDEYTRPGEWSGYLNVLEVDSSGCIMDTANWCISSGTRGQIGWKDSDGDNIMDPEDTIPTSVLNPYVPNPTSTNILTYTGTAEEVPLTNRNPFYNAWLGNHRVNAGNDVSINTITQVEFRIDGGAWLPASPMDGAFDEAVEAFTFTTPPLSDGTHTIETRSRNTVGNWQTSYASDTITIDTTPPMTSYMLEGTLGKNGWYQSPVTISLIAQDAISGVRNTKYRLNGGEWQDYFSPFLLTGNGDFAMDYYSTDTLDNIETNGHLKIRIDMEAPLTSDSISSSLGMNGWFTTNVTIALAAADMMSGLQYTYYSIDGGIYQIYSGPFLITGDSTHLISYYSIDLAGNVEKLKQREVKIDVTSPATGYLISGILGSNGWYTSSVTVELDPVDIASGIEFSKYRLNGENWLDYVGRFQIARDGIQTLEFFSGDYAGNIESIHLIRLMIDTTPPTTLIRSTGTLGINGWYTGEVKIEIEASDSLSGLQTIFYRLDGDPWLTYSGPFQISQDGVHFIDYYSVDLAGNMESSSSFDFKIDTTPPTTLYKLWGISGWNGWYRGNVSIGLDYLDDTSGVSETHFRIDGGGWKRYTEEVPLDGDGTHTIQFYSEDNASNREEIRTFQIKIDKTSPSAHAVVSGEIGDNGWYLGVVRTYIEAYDATSGVLRIEFSLDDDVWLDYTGMMAIASDGNHTIAFRSVDLAGNIGPEAILHLNIDSNSPVIDSVSINGFSNPGRLTTSTIILAWEGSDATSGIDHYRVRLDSGPYLQVGMEKVRVLRGLSDGVHILTLEAVDRAGNSLERAISFTIETSASETPLITSTILLAIILFVILIVALTHLIRKKGKSEGNRPN